MLGYVSGSRPARDAVGVTVHVPERAWPGLNFCVPGHGPEAILDSPERRDPGPRNRVARAARTVGICVGRFTSAGPTGAHAPTGSFEPAPVPLDPSERGSVQAGRPRVSPHVRDHARAPQSDGALAPLAAGEHSGSREGDWRRRPRQAGTSRGPSALMRRSRRS